MATSDAKKPVDWEAIEPHWRAGIKTKLEISQEFGVSRAAIDKHFAKLGIERDLTAKIQAKAESLVARQAVTETVTRNRLAATEQEIVEANANIQADAQLKHIEQAGAASSVGDVLFAELTAITLGKEDFEKLGELMESPDENGRDRLNELYQKVIGFAGRVDAYKKLVDARKVAIELERKVLRIKDDVVIDAVPAVVSIKF